MKGLSLGGSGLFAPLRVTSLLVIGWIVRATATVTSVIPAMIVTGRIVRSLTAGKPATIITRGIIYALTTGEPAFVIP